MSDSLVIGSDALGYFELVDQSGGSPYEVTADADLGAPVPDTATIEGVLLDGDRVSGQRSGNRTLNLPTRVTGTSKADVSTKVAALQRIVDSPSFTVQWTPDGSSTVVYDCFRGTSPRSRIVEVEDAFMTSITLNFPALPYGRSVDAQTIAVTASSQIDSFDTAPTGATLDASVKYEGTGSAKFAFTSYTNVGFNPHSTSATVSRTFAARDYSDHAAVSLRVRMPDTVPTSVTLTLTSAAGSATYTSKYVTATGSKWALISVSLTGGTGTVDLSAVTGYSLHLSALLTDLTGDFVNIDDLRVLTAASSRIVTAYGDVLTVPAVSGTARAPVSATVDIGGATFTNLLLHRPPGDQDPDLAILMALASGSATVDSDNAAYDGTYSAVALLSAHGTGSRTITLTVTQDVDGTTVATGSVAVTTATTLALIPLGLITLPLAAVPPECTTVSYTFAITAGGSDIVAALGLCDTRGQTIVATGLPTSTTVVYVDEPDPASGIGRIYASATDRTAASSVLGLCRTSGGPFQMEPGDQALLAASTLGSPNLTVKLRPRWLDEVA